MVDGYATGCTEKGYDQQPSSIEKADRVRRKREQIANDSKQKHFLMLAAVAKAFAWCKESTGRQRTYKFIGIAVKK